jgi:hypothetical protein
VAGLEHLADEGATGAVIQQLGAMVSLFRPPLPVPSGVAAGRPARPVSLRKPAAVAGEATGAA